MKKQILAALAIPSLLVSCQFFGNDSAEGVDMKRDPIVTVNDQTLYRSELDKNIPIHLIGEDSAKVANEYIKIWVDEHLIYNKASQNQTNKQAIEELVEDYRRTLMTNSYRERILKEYFTASITEDKMKEYYGKNKDLFVLEEAIIKGLFLKIPKGSSELKNFRKWYTQNSETAISNIEKYTMQNAVNYEYFYDRWVSMPELMHNVPMAIPNYATFLKGKKSLEVTDSSYVYLLNISEYKLVGDKAPYEYIKDRLGEIYKEKNRSVYLKQIQGEMYEKALSSKKIRYYND